MNDIGAGIALLLAGVLVGGLLVILALAPMDQELNCWRVMQSATCYTERHQ